MLMIQIQLCFTICVAGLDPWFSLELPQKCNHKILFIIGVTEVSPVHSTRALNFLAKGSSRLVMKKLFFMSEVLVPGMSRLYDCITLFSASHRRMYSNGIEAGKLLDQMPSIEENSEILIPRLWDKTQLLVLVLYQGMEWLQPCSQDEV